MKEDKHTRNFIILMVVITLLAIIIAFTTKEEIFPDPSRESFKPDREKIDSKELVMSELRNFEVRQNLLPRLV